MTTALLVEWAVEAAEKRIIPFTLFTFFPSPMLTFWDYVFPSRPFGALCKRFYCILQHLFKILNRRNGRDGARSGGRATGSIFYLLFV